MSQQTIKIELYNTLARVPKEDTISTSLVESCLFLYVSKMIKMGKQRIYVQDRFPLYWKSEEGDIFFPRGLLDILPQEVFEIDSKETKELPDIKVEDLDDQEIATILQPESGFDLRDDQVMAIKKILLFRRGIAQLATGAGKTEIMAALLKLFNKHFGYYPKTVIIVPTNHLAGQTKKRLSKYKIPIVDYREYRDISASPVFVTHPKALQNDILRNPKVLENVKVMIYDEGHHLKAESWHSLHRALPNLEYSIALSASAVDPDRVTCRNLYEFTLDEALIIGATGRVLVNIPPSYYIKKGILAMPVVFKLYHPANEKLQGRWDKSLEAASRNALLANAAAFFAKYNRKVLILVNTTNHAFLLLEKFADLGYADQVRAAFGGGRNFKWVSYDPYIVPDYEDVFDLFDEGKIKILIGTSHLDEGFDVPNLDVCILGGGGKKDRKIIQRLGRMMRKTKTGKYGYVVDFTDHENPMLRKHSYARSRYYRKLIGIPEQYIFEGITFPEMKKLFFQLEEIDPNQEPQE